MGFWKCACLCILLCGSEEKKKKPEMLQKLVVDEQRFDAQVETNANCVNLDIHAWLNDVDEQSKIDKISCETFDDATDKMLQNYSQEKNAWGFRNGAFEPPLNQYRSRLKKKN